MKKILTATVLFLFYLVHANAQGNFEIGYSFGYMNSPNLNRSVYVYNYTRQWLTDKMDYFNGGKGWYVSYAKIYDHVGCEFGFSTFRERNIASGLEPTTGKVAYRRISRGSNGFYLGIPIRIVNTEHLEINFVPTADMEWNYVNTDYTHDGSFEKIEESEGMGGGFKLGSSAGIALRFFPLNWLGVSAKPFVAFSYTKTDVGDVQRVLQGSRIPFVVPDPFTIYGVSFALIFTNRDDY